MIADQRGFSMRSKKSMRGAGNRPRKVEKKHSGIETAANGAILALLAVLFFPVLFFIRPRKGRA